MTGCFPSFRKKVTSTAKFVVAVIFMFACQLPQRCPLKSGNIVRVLRVSTLTHFHTTRISEDVNTRASANASWNSRQCQILQKGKRKKRNPLRESVELIEAKPDLGDTKNIPPHKVAENAGLPNMRGRLTVERGVRFPWPRGFGQYGEDPPPKKK